MPQNIFNPENIQGMVARMAMRTRQSWVNADDIEYIVYFNGNAQNRNANLNNAANRWNASNEVLAE